MNFDKDKRYDIVIRVNRRDVKIVKETETTIKICCNYRLQNNPKWEPIYSTISKEVILKVKELQ